MKQLPPTKKRSFLRSQFQNMVADEIGAWQNNFLQLHLQTQANTQFWWQQAYTIVLCTYVASINTVVWCLNNLLQLPIWVCCSTDHRYEVFMHSYCSYCKSCNHDICINLATCIIVSTNAFISHYECSSLPMNRMAPLWNWIQYVKCETRWPYLSVWTVFLPRTLLSEYLLSCMKCAAVYPALYNQMLKTTFCSTRI